MRHAPCGAGEKLEITSNALGKVKQLLEQTELTLAEIAEKIGLVSDYYLIRLFKGEFGMTPGDYRKANNQ